MKDEKCWCQLKCFLGNANKGEKCKIREAEIMELQWEFISLQFSALLGIWTKFLW